MVVVLFMGGGHMRGFTVGVSGGFLKITLLPSSS